jgi:N-acetylmuramoyl-L-alanine amidase
MNKYSFKSFLLIPAIKRKFTIMILLLLTFIAIGCNVKPNSNSSTIMPTQTNADIQVIVVEQMPTLTPAPTNNPTPTPHLPLAGFIIGIDPGHQAKADNSEESVSPKYTSMKKKVSSGTKGFWSDIYEYEVTLSVGLILRDILIANGATVRMTRTMNDVNISNSERAMMFNEAETNYALRIHCNGSKDQTKNGASILIPKENPFLDHCRIAANILLEEYCLLTEIEANGIVPRGDQTGFNWCDRMILNIEMGYMSNPEDEEYLSNTANHKVMAQGLANGILKYFETYVSQKGLPSIVN